MDKIYITKNDYLDFVENKFRECFLSKGYIEEKAVNITSQVDPTVDFIGSKISPLKKYILDGNIGEQGRFLIQNSMKLKSLKYLKTLNPQVFGSYYKCMGTLTEPNLEKIVFDTFDYLINPKFLNINPEDICIRINSKDRDLLDSIKNIDSLIKKEIDTVEEKHYRHKYGLDEQHITGRDFNIGIRKRNTSDYFNCGTLVIMENLKGPIAVDMGIGNCSLSMCEFGTNTTVESSRMADVINIDSIEMIKFADSLIAVSTLLKENILEHTSKHFRKKFRLYCQALGLWKEKLQISDEAVLEYMNKYLALEYKEYSNVDEKKLEKILKKR